VLLPPQVSRDVTLERKLLTMHGTWIMRRPGDGVKVADIKPSMMSLSPCECAAAPVQPAGVPAQGRSGPNCITRQLVPGIAQQVTRRDTECVTFCDDLLNSSVVAGQHIVCLFNWFALGEGPGCSEEVCGVLLLLGGLSPAGRAAQLSSAQLSFHNRCLTHLLSAACSCEGVHERRGQGARLRHQGVLLSQEPAGRHDVNRSSTVVASLTR